MEVLLDTRGEKLKSLLFIFIFVGNVAAECPRPQPGENMVPTDEALLKNDFPDGSQVTLQCGNGYVKERGSEVITCIKGQWTQPDLICKKKDCGPPKEQPHMLFDTRKGTLFGAVVKVYCDKGYEIAGSVSLRCYDAGWFGDTECVLVACDYPAKVANGRHSEYSKEFPENGDIISYTCDAGYTLSGNSSIMCTETGEYNSPPPECIETFTSTVSSATPATHRDTTITASASPSSSTSDRGARYRPTAVERSSTTTVTSTLSSSFGETLTKTVNTSKDNAVILVAISVVGFLIVLLIIVFFVLKFYLRRKGSYDTREDQKPELLQFQNL